MLLARILAGAGAAALASVAGLATASSAAAHSTTATTEPGSMSLASVLAADGSGFDRNPRDYDIVDNAVGAVLGAKPGSPVAVLADGSVPLTAFLPNDLAFKRLATDLTGQHYTSEQAAFGAVASLGIDTVEAVLLYHVVPGATIDYRAALGADGAALETAAGGPVTVDVRPGHRVFLVDADPDDRNARVVWRDLNRGNLQIAHGISEVLRPVDL